MRGMSVAGRQVEAKIPMNEGYREDERQKTEDGKREDRKRETGDRRRETGNGKRETGIRKQEDESGIE